MSTTPQLMGIINVTPDSFSGDGVLSGDYIARAVAQGEQMVADGATMLDIGGESSRPGAEPVSATEEIRRVIPVIAALKKKLGHRVVLAVDTIKADVAEQAVRAGASIINDISALAHDPLMGEVAAHSGVKLILMHNRSAATKISSDAKIGSRYEAAEYVDVVADVMRDLKTSADVAIKAGVARDKIILDPGIGFGKTPQQNLTLIAQLDPIKALGFPVLMGLSRKSFIGDILDVGIDERLAGTAVAVTMCVLQGVDILRIHDVKFMVQVVKMAVALAGSQSAPGNSPRMRA